MAEVEETAPRQGFSVSDEGEYQWEPSGVTEGAVEGEGLAVGGGAGGRRGRPIIAYITVILITAILFIFFIVSAIRYESIMVERVDCAESWEGQQWSACMEECPAEGKEAGRGHHTGGYAIIRSKVLREPKGGGLECRREIKAQCSRYRRIRVKLGGDDKKDGPVTVCPRSSFPRKCKPNPKAKPNQPDTAYVLTPDWSAVKKGQFYSIPFHRYAELFEEQPINASDYDIYCQDQVF